MVSDAGGNYCAFGNLLDSLSEVGHGRSDIGKRERERAMGDIEKFS